jgi:hypothetical protein
MKDRDFLIWIHERLQNVHKENPHYDYMHKLRCIIRAIPEDQVTPNMDSKNSLEEMLKSIGHKQ